MDALLCNNAPLSSPGLSELTGPIDHSKVNNTKSKNNTKAPPKDVIRIISWNIRGLTDKIFEKDTQDIIFSNDIVILTETHTEVGSDIFYNVIPNFIFHNFPRKFKHPNAPKASGGIGIYVRSDLQIGINVSLNHESIIKLQLKSEFFHAEHNINILCTYFPPADSSYNQSTNSRTDYFNLLQEALAAIDCHDEIIICGDFNARVGNLSDIPEHIDGSDGDLSGILSPHIISNAYSIPERHTVDQHVNDYGRQLINMCRSIGLCIANGRVSDIINNKDFTCYKTVGASVVDYVLCKVESMSLIQKLTLLPKRPESDHRPLHFILELPNRKLIKVEQSKEIGCQPHQYRWDHRKKEEYINTFHNRELVNLESQLSEIINENGTTCNEIDEAFKHYLNTAIKAVFKRKRSLANKFPVNRWFNEECKTAKKLVVEYAHNNDITEPEHAHQYRQLEKNYNRIKQKEKRNHAETVRCRLENFSAKDPSSYWKMWKSLKHNTVNNSILTLSNFETYFQSQIYPPQIESFDTSHMNELRDFVINYLTQDEPPYNNNSNVDFKVANEICDSPIMYHEVEVHLKKTEKQ